MSVEEKTRFQKMLTDWIFNQSVGVIISLAFVVVSQVEQKDMKEEIRQLQSQLKELLTYQRDKMQSTLDENTRQMERFNLRQR